MNAPVKREIRPLDEKKFGEKAELKEKLKAILKDVPVLHERLGKCLTDLEALVGEFREATEKAQRLVSEWEAIPKEDRP